MIQLFFVVFFLTYAAILPGLAWDTPHNYDNRGFENVPLWLKIPYSNSGHTGRWKLQFEDLHSKEVHPTETKQDYPVRFSCD